MECVSSCFYLLGDVMEKNVKIKPRRMVKILFLVIIILFLLFLYARYINTSGLVVKETAIIDEAMNEAYNGLKIVQFSDIHYGRTTFQDDMEKLVQSINELNPDILIFTGDLFDSDNISDEDIKLMSDYLNELQARLFKFAVIGDYDQQYIDTYHLIMNDSGFTILDNTSKLVYDNALEPINFVGLTSTSDIKSLYDNNYFTITSMHQPDMVQDLPNSNIVFAGHSLGGQIKMPFIGGIIKKDGARTYLNDYYKVDGMQLYISNGIGTENFSFRLFNKPSITLYRLYNY